MEYTDTKVKDYKKKLKERDTRLANLKSEVRINRNEQDDLVCYNCREMFKIRELRSEKAKIQMKV